jgi:hypothetical protein
MHMPPPWLEHDEEHPLGWLRGWFLTLHCDAPRPVRCAHAHTREGRVGQMWYAEREAHGGRIRMRRTVDFIHHRAPVSIGNARVGNNARRIMQRPVSLTRFSPFPSSCFSRFSPHPAFHLPSKWLEAKMVLYDPPHAQTKHTDEGRRAGAARRLARWASRALPRLRTRRCEQ